MTNGDPNVLVMQLTWRRLWKPGTPYYLPTAIVNGAQGNGITVTALGQIGIADTGAIPLVNNSTWGSLFVDLQLALVGGLETMTDGGMTYDSASGPRTASDSWSDRGAGRGGV